MAGKGGKGKKGGKAKEPSALAAIRPVVSAPPLTEPVAPANDPAPPPAPSRNPNEGHRARLRDKFMAHGIDKLTDDEVVELLLTLATPRRDCKKTARAALKAFGGLAQVLEAPVEELVRVEGIGPANAFGIRLVQQVARRFLRERALGRDYLRSFSDLLDYYNHALRDQRTESFHALYLDAKNGLIAEERLATGTADAVAVSPRQVVEGAIRAGAASVVVHNHPGGLPSPSPQNMALTRELVHAARMVDLTLREHLIVAREGYYSFWKEGLIGRMEEEFAAYHRKLME